MNTDHDPAPFSAPSLDELQPLFPAYRIEGFIAQGGMGAIYRAYQTALDRPVAIKILPREFGADESFRASFAAEAKAMARLNHPNLISVFDFGDADGMLFIVMELIDGVSLHEWSAGKEVPPAKAVELVVAVCRGIAHAHEHSLLHRDIKPGNILLDGKLRPKIGDFGLARPLDQAATEDEVVFGTPGYAAPELTQGGTVDERSDIYALGALLHRLLTGKEPTEHPLPPVSALCGAPLILDTLIARATAPDSEQRFSSADEFADNLQQSARLAARPPSVRPAAPTPPPPVSVPNRSAAAPAKSGSSIGPIAAVIGIGSVIGGVLFLATRDNDSDIEISSGGNSVIPVDLDSADSRSGGNTNVPTDDSRDRTAEPSAQSLARLKDKLASGARDEFPEGTASHEGSHFLVVGAEMTWPEAQRFAEAHGAHLAVLPTEDDLAWFRDTFQFSDPLWLGAGASANDRFQWLDGSPWNSEVKTSGGSNAGRGIALSATGGLFPSDSSKAYRAALQWRADGSNPATLDAQLARTAASADSNDKDLSRIAYPVGTRTLGDSHYFHLARTISWDEARRFADSLGAHLAVPSTPEEHNWLLETFGPQLAAGHSAWLGGFRLEPGERWQWLTREAWNNGGWLPDHPLAGEKLNRLAVHAATDSSPAGWVAGDGVDGVADGMILEWSPPRDPVAVASFDLEPWLAGVNRKIASRVASDLDAFAEVKEDLVQDYVRSMNRIVRKEEDEPLWGNRGRGRDRDDDEDARDPRNFRWPGQSRRALETIEEELKEASKNGQLLAALPVGASEAFREQHEKSAADLALVEETYSLKLNDQLTFYLDGIGRKGADLGDVGYLDHARELNALAASLEGDLPAFLKLLFGDSPRARLPWAPPDGPAIEGDANDPAPNPFGLPADPNQPPPGPKPEPPDNEPMEPLFPGFEIEETDEDS